MIFQLLFDICGPLANASLAEVIASVRDKSTAMRRNIGHNLFGFTRFYTTSARNQHIKHNVCSFTCLYSLLSLTSFSFQFSTSSSACCKRVTSLPAISNSVFKSLISFAFSSVDKEVSSASTWVKHVQLQQASTAENSPIGY